MSISVGTIVFFHPATNIRRSVLFEPDAVFAAIVAKVLDNGNVNLAVFDGNGAAVSMTDVPLQQGSDVPKDGYYIGTSAPVAAPPLTLSAPAPTGTLTTPSTATLGATTNQSNGTLYGVVDTAANLASVTAAQIKAGQNASGAGALAASNSAVGTSTPGISASGLSPGVTYSYALVQGNGRVTSNIVTGTFTTAAASASAPSPLPSPLTPAPVNAARLS